MKKTTKRMMALALASSMALSLTACGGSETKETAAATAAAGNEAATEAAATPAEGKTKVTVGIAQTYESMSPIRNYDRYGSPVGSHVYEVLAEADDADGGELIGVLMKEWSTEDNLSYSCTLYDGIKDSAGNPFTADDVKFTIEKDMEAALEWASYVESVEVVDDTHFILKLTSDGPGIFEQTVSSLWMCTEEAYTASEDGLATEPIGTGPYVCTDFVSGERTILEVNENYWQSDDLRHPNYQANVDVIEFQVIKEATQMELALENGDIQIGFWVSLNVADQLEGVEGIQVEACPHWSSKNFYFDMKEGSMFANNLALRQAVLYAIDGESLMIALTKGYGSVSKAYGDATQTGYNPEWENHGYYEYDLDKALALFEEAKPQLVKDGFDPAKLNIRYVCYNSDEERLAGECIQADLAKLGINMEIVPADASAYTTYLDAAAGQFEIAAANGNFGSYINTFWSVPFDRNIRESGNTRFGLHDDHLQEMMELCSSKEGFTQENLDEFYYYITDNALIYQYYKSAAICAHEDGINIEFDWRSLPRVGSFEFADDYAHFAE